MNSVYDLMNYGFREAVDFDGLMPKVAEKVGVIGGSDVVVKEHGIEAMGTEALEVMDASQAFASGVSDDGHTSDGDSDTTQGISEE